MPRRELRRKEKRFLVLPDERYNSILIARFINKINFRGKKNLASNILYKAFDIIKEKTGQEPLKVFNQAIENARPLLAVKPRRIGGATYQVPVEVPKFRGETLVMRWILSYARARKGTPMYKKLSEEIISAYKKEGSVIKKREETHKMADANKAFAHYRW